MDHREVQLTNYIEEERTRSTMANDDDSKALDRAYQPSPGLGVAVSDPVQNPGLPPHRERMTDKDPKAEKLLEGAG